MEQPELPGPAGGSVNCVSHVGRRSSPKAEHTLTCDLAVPLQGVNPVERHTNVYPMSFSRMFGAASPIIGQAGKSRCPSAVEWTCGKLPQWTAVVSKS